MSNSPIIFDLIFFFRGYDDFVRFRHIKFGNCVFLIVFYFYIFYIFSYFFISHSFVYFYLKYGGVRIFFRFDNPRTKDTFFFKFCYRSVCAFFCEAFSSYTSLLFVFFVGSSAPAIAETWLFIFRYSLQYILLRIRFKRIKENVNVGVSFHRFFSMWRMTEGWYKRWFSVVIRQQPQTNNYLFFLFGRWSAQHGRETLTVLKD
jgi:hypothetical protein